MLPLDLYRLAITRRHFLQECGIGLGRVALATLLAQSTSRGRVTAADTAPNPLAPRQPHFPGKARRVIHLFMGGAPSQLELFDYKPMLAELEGQPLPPSVIGDQRYAFIRPDAAVLGPRFEFARHGDCGAELSSAAPHLPDIVDQIAILRAVHTDQFNHAPAQIFLSTGFAPCGVATWLMHDITPSTSTKRLLFSLGCLWCFVRNSACGRSPTGSKRLASAISDSLSNKSACERIATIP